MPKLVFYSILISALALGVAALWLAGEVWEEHETGEVVDLTTTGAASQVAPGFLPLEEILRRLSLPVDSHILEVEKEIVEDRLLYEIELLMPDGRVLEWYVDPRTATVISVETGETSEAHHATAAGGR